MKLVINSFCEEEEVHKTPLLCERAQYLKNKHWEKGNNVAISFKNCIESSSLLDVRTT